MVLHDNGSCIANLSIWIRALWSHQQWRKLRPSGTRSSFSVIFPITAFSLSNIQYSEKDIFLLWSDFSISLLFKSHCWRFCLSSASYLQQDVLIWISCIPSDSLIFEGEHIHIFKVVSLHSLVYFSLRFSQDFIWIVKRFYTSWHDHQLPLSPVLQLFSSLTCSHVFVWSGACPHAKSASDHHHHPKYVFSPLSPLDIIIVKAAILHFYQFAICKRTYGRTKNQGTAWM